MREVSLEPNSRRLVVKSSATRVLVARRLARGVECLPSTPETWRLTSRKTHFLNSSMAVALASLREVVAGFVATARAAAGAAGVLALLDALAERDCAAGPVGILTF